MDKLEQDAFYLCLHIFSLTKNWQQSGQMSKRNLQFVFDNDLYIVVKMMAASPYHNAASPYHNEAVNKWTGRPHGIVH